MKDQSKGLKLWLWANIVVLTILLPLVSAAQTTITYDVAGIYSWTVPAGVTQVTVELWGGGGAGGGSTSNRTAGGGGGGGAYRKITNIPVVAGLTYTNIITVGAGGTGGTGNGTAGSASSINFATLYTANGGGGGVSGNNGGGGGAGGNGATYAGGAGASGNSGNRTGGGGGSSAGTAANGNTGSTFNGGAAVTNGGPGGTGANNGDNDTDGNDPVSGPGGGGGGAYRKTGTATGGNGFSGMVKITYCTTFSLTSTTASTACRNGSSVITLNSSATILPVGTYTVNYSINGQSTNVTMNVTTAGTGSFSTVYNLQNPGNYNVVINSISNGTCSNSIVGNNTTTIVVYQPSTFNNNNSNYYTCSNSAFNFTPGSNQSGTTFSWTRAAVSGISNAAGSGTGNISETLVNTTSSNVQVTYQFTLNYNGCTSTGTIYAYVMPLPVANVPASYTVCNNTNISSTTFTSNMNNVNYNWTNSNTAIGVGASGSGSTFQGFTAKNTASTSNISGTISVTPNYSSNNATCYGTPSTFTITVKPTPTNVVFTGNTNQSLCGDSTTTAVSFSNSTPGTVFTWTNNNTTTGMPANGTGNIPAYTVVNSTTNQIVSTFTVTPTLNGCTGNASTFTITVRPTPVNQGFTSVSYAYCDPVTQIHFDSKNWSGTTHHWSGPDGWTSGGTNADWSHPKTTGWVYLYTDLLGCKSKLDSQYLTINTTPTVSQPADQSLCANSTTTAVNFSGTNDTYTWTNDNTSIGLAASGTGNIAAFTATNSGTDIQIANITITPSNPGCGAGTPKSFKITVNPIPVVAGYGNKTFCDGTVLAADDFTSTVSGTTYAWTNSNTAIGLPASGTGSVPAFTATNPGTVYITSTLKVTPTANGCAGAVKNYSIRVNPKPSINAISGQSVCSGSSTAAVTFGGIASSYSWSNNNTSVGLASSGTTSSIPAFTAINNGTTTATATVTVTPRMTGCSNGTPAVFNIAVAPAAVGGTVSASANSLCAGTNTSSLTLTGYTGSITSWQRSTDNGATWTSITNTTSTLTINNQPAETAYLYRAVVQSGICSPAYSSTVLISVKSPVTLTPTNVAASPAAICPGSTSTLSATISGYAPTGPLLYEDFGQAMAPGWDGASAGNNSAKDPEEWGETNGGKNFSGTYYESNLGGKFMITNGLINAELLSPIFSTVGLLSGDLEFYQAFKLEAGAAGYIEMSVDGGATYGITLLQYTGAQNFGNPNNGFQKVTIPLANYAGFKNVRIRFRYVGTATSSWAFDNLQLPATFEQPTYSWSPASSLTPNTGIGMPIPATPTTTTTYTVTAYLAGCPGGSASTTVTVKSTPVISATATSPVCSGLAMTPISLSSSMGSTTYSYTISNPGNITGLTATSAGVISGTPVNNTNSPQTITYTARGTSGGCPGSPITISIVVNPRVNVSLSGNQSICTGSPATLTITSNVVPVSVRLSNGVTYNLTASPYSVSVSPTANTTYSITSISNVTCASNAISSGTATVTIPTSTVAVGTWMCNSDNDWFNPCNWGGGQVPTNSIDVIIPASASCSPVINPNSAFAPLDKIARARNINISKNLSLTNNADLYISGNWQNNLGASGFTAGTGTVTMMGSVPQTITTTSGSTETFGKLVVNNTSGGSNALVMNNAVNVSNTLTLTRGVVKTTATNLLTVTNPSSTAVVGGSTTSYIYGPIDRQTNSTDDYVYPVGDPNGPYSVYRPTIIAPAASAANVYRSEYKATASAHSGSLAASTVSGIIKSEHWEIDRTIGTTDAVLKLYYMQPVNVTDWSTGQSPCTTCNVAIVTPMAPSNLWYFTNGYDFTTGFSTALPETRHYTNSGLIYSKQLSNFGDFTFGYSYAVILPVKLVSFEGKPSGNGELLTWKLENAKDAVGFELQAGTDGVHFNKIASIDANGQSVYNYTSTLSQETTYYRLLIRQKNGEVVYSNVILTINKQQTVIAGVKPTILKNEAEIIVRGAHGQTLFGTLFDISGRTLASYKELLTNGDNNVRINTQFLPAGIYTLHVRLNDGTFQNFRLLKE